MADKKPRKCLSVPQVFIRTASRLSAQPAFICANRIRAVSLFHARRIYLRRTPFIRTNRVCLRHPRFYPFRTPFFSAHRTLSAPQAFLSAP